MSTYMQLNVKIIFHGEMKLHYSVVILKLFSFQFSSLVYFLLPSVKQEITFESCSYIEIYVHSYIDHAV